MYAIGIQVQRTFPVQFKNIFWMMVPLHIEMVILNCVGDWLRGSGWCEVYEASKINTPGRIGSFLKGKRSRYDHQVTLSVLLIFARDSFQRQTTLGCFNDWKENLAKVSVNAHYWFTVIDLEICIFMFVRILHEGNFDSFVRCIKDILPWSFALNHVHYSRWMSVFMYDLICLPEEHRDIFTQVMDGNSTVIKTNHVFSNMGMDQAHEQNNKRVKVDGGAIGILDNVGCTPPMGCGGTTNSRNH